MFIFSHHSTVSNFQVCDCFPLCSIASFLPLSRRGLVFFKSVKDEFGKKQRFLYLVQKLLIFGLIFCFLSSIFPKNIVNVFGVSFHVALSMSPHIFKICHIVFSCLRSFYRIRCFLSKHDAALLFSSVVLPYLDYCNIALLDINMKQSKQLQSI